MKNSPRSPSVSLASIALYTLVPQSMASWPEELPDVDLAAAEGAEGGAEGDV